jgi:oligopeptide transport system substrate-binding protein
MEASSEALRTFACRKIPACHQERTQIRIQQAGSFQRARRAFPLPSSRTDTLGKEWYNLPVNVSNGAYQLSAVAQGDRLELRRNPHYHGVFPGNIEKIECVILDDYAAAFDSFDQGELDMVSMITSDPGTVRQARRRYRNELHFVPHLSTLFVSFWCEKPPFERADVRSAFVRAVDRSALVNETSQGQYQPALGGFLPPGMAGYQADIGLSYDPEMARTLLADAGYPGGDNFPTVRLLFTGPDPHNPIIQFLCKVWRDELGVEVQAENTTWEEFLRRRGEDPPELSVMGYSADYPDPDAILRVLFHSELGFNPSNFYSAEFNSLVESAAEQLDPSQRIKAYQDADKILVREEAAVLPLGYGRGRLLITPSLEIPAMPLSQIRMKEVVVGSNPV